jgi:hypothetical protein
VNYLAIFEEAQRHIEEIQKSYITGDVRVLEALTGAMRIVEKTFTRSGHFVLEFIQNAEDAEARRVKIVLENGAIKIFNDGKPFTREDVEAICSIGRSRKDPRKHIGYLGVGFKAVFLVSSRPHIYSKTYRFKFDKHYWEGKYGNVPWQITPIWLDEVPEELKDWNVYFYIPIDERKYEEKIKGELENLTSTTLLFLRSIDELELVFNSKNKVFRREKREENENYAIYTLKEVENGIEKESNWVVFRRVVKVPDEVKADKYTKDWNRDKVEYREIAVAFKLDNTGDLEPIPGTVKFGVFSYVPLKEEPIELPYYIHADFLVAPGRNVIHREALWNRWILREAAKFIVEHVIKVFESHEKWKYSYINILYKKTYRELFDECLINPIIEEIEKGPHFVTIDGNLARLSEVVRVDQKVLEALGPRGVLLVERLTSKKVLDPKVLLPYDLVYKLKESNSLVEDVKDLRKYLKDQDLERLREKLKDVWDLVIEWILGPSELVKRLRDPSTGDQEKIAIVKRLKELWKKKVVSAEDLIKEGFVIRTKSGKWIEPQKALLPSEYEPYENVERLVKAGLLDPELVEFVDPIFIKDATRDEVNEWRDFLQDLKVGTDENMIRKLVENIGIRVALKYEREVLGVKDARVLTEPERYKGCDIESRMPDGSPKYIEVKASRDWLPSIELTRNEYQHILNNPERSFVYVVASVFSDLTLYIIPGTALSDLIPARITIWWSDWSSKVKEKWRPSISEV